MAGGGRPSWPNRLIVNDPRPIVLQDAVVTNPRDTPVTRKAIIAGGAGFIGSHLSARLKAQGLELILVDNLSTGINSRP